MIKVILAPRTEQHLERLMEDPRQRSASTLKIAPLEHNSWYLNGFLFYSHDPTSWYILVDPKEVAEPCDFLAPRCWKFVEEHFPDVARSIHRHAQDTLRALQTEADEFERMQGLRRVADNWKTYLEGDNS